MTDMLDDMGRMDAIEEGKRLAEAEHRLFEPDEEREKRIRRAMRYAAWVFDGKPHGIEATERLNREFGLEPVALTGSLERAPFLGTFKEPKKKG